MQDQVLPEIEITYGKLRGIQRGGHVVFLGVPYAKPPVGELRFRRRSAAAWSGVRDAVAFGPSAPQDLLSVPPFKAVVPESEDCLYLNVYTPALDAGRRPVLFWIHGGGFSHGAGTQPWYDGGPLAVRGDVVVVTINYRLGALGYLYLGGQGGAEWGAAANAGQLDQIAALRWVRDNIAAFGGDPAQVTIFGESAGAVAVATLLAMPEAEGLFGKAIAQSGTANRLANAAAASAITARYLQSLGVVDADPGKLRSVSVEALLRAQGPRGPLSPVIEGAQLAGAAALGGAPGHGASHSADGRDEPRRVQAVRAGAATRDRRRGARASSARATPRGAAERAARRHRRLSRVACGPRATSQPPRHRRRGDHGVALPHSGDATVRSTSDAPTAHVLVPVRLGVAGTSRRARRLPRPRGSVRVRHGRYDGQ